VFSCHHTLPDNSIHRELGLEPCGFCGADGCITKLGQKGSGGVNIISNCQYAFTSLNYEKAKVPTKTSPCTNIPISCPFCLPSQQSHFIWKYNTIAHMATQHPQEKIPLDFLSQIHISFKEAELMKVGPEGVKVSQKTHDVPNSDGFEEATISDKWTQATSTSSLGGARKNSRYQ
jgi:hypothetical protein